MSTFSFKTNCKPLPSFQVHKALCQKYVRERKKTELTEAFDRYRDENLKIYKKKCEAFLESVKSYHDDNFYALTHHKSSSRRTPEWECICTPRKHCGGDDKLDLMPQKVTSTSGSTRRWRSKRYFFESPQIEAKRCEIEPWFKRYLVLSRFINVARSIIIKNRMLKRLEKLKDLRKNPDLLREYETDGFHQEFLTYPEISEKFLPRD